MSKQLLEAFSARANVRAGACGDCEDGVIIGGDGDFIMDVSQDIPCPTCSPLREIANWCWHNYSLEAQECLTCGQLFKECKNPHFTIPLIRQTLEALGDWERFVEWHNEQVWHRWQRMSGDWSFEQADIVCSLASADILTDETLLAEAVINFYREGVG